MGRTRVPLLLSLVHVVLLLPVFTGCGSVSVNGAVLPSPTPTATPSPTPLQASRFIYGTPGFESGSVQAAAILGDGSVAPVVGSPFSEGMGQPSILQIVADSRGRFIYVLNVEASAVGIQIGPPGIAAFQINHQTGALTLAGAPILFPVRNDNLMTLDGLGRFLFEPNGQGNATSTSFDVYSIDQNTGALTKTPSTSNAPPVGSFTAASADGQFVFNAGNGQVEVFSIVSPTGQLLAVPGTPLGTAGSAGPIAASSDGKFLYVANQNEGSVMVFAIGSGGTLTVVPGAPFGIDPGAQFIALTPDGRFLYVASFALTATGANQTVKGYAVNPLAGTFVPIADAVINNVDAVAIDLSGRFAYISTPGTLFTFGINPTTGALSQLSRTTAPSTDNEGNLVTVP